MPYTDPKHNEAENADPEESGPGSIAGELDLSDQYPNRKDDAGDTEARYKDKDKQQEVVGPDTASDFSHNPEHIRGIPIDDARLRSNSQAVREDAEKELTQTQKDHSDEAGVLPSDDEIYSPLQGELDPEEIPNDRAQLVIQEFVHVLHGEPKSQRLEHVYNVATKLLKGVDIPDEQFVFPGHPVNGGHPVVTSATAKPYGKGPGRADRPADYDQGPDNNPPATESNAA